MTPDRLVPIGALIARGVQEQEARHITGNKATVPWHELARADGGLALAVMTDQEFDLIRQELGRAGVPTASTLTHQDVFNLIVAIAENECPAKGTLWYSTELHSAVACAQLLALVQQSWGFDDQDQRQKELDLFASRLGVTTTVETV